MYYEVKIMFWYFKHKLWFIKLNIEKYIYMYINIHIYILIPYVPGLMEHSVYIRIHT